MAWFPCVGGEDIPVIAPDYDSTVTYNKEDVVLYNGITYICNTDGTTGTWNSTYWTKCFVADLTQYNSNLGGKVTSLGTYTGNATIDLTGVAYNTVDDFILEIVSFSSGHARGQGGEPFFGNYVYEYDGGSSTLSKAISGDNLVISGASFNASCHGWNSGSSQSLNQVTYNVYIK